MSVPLQRCVGVPRRDGPAIETQGASLQGYQLHSARILQESETFSS